MKKFGKAVGVFLVFVLLFLGVNALYQRNDSVRANFATTELLGRPIEVKYNGEMYVQLLGNFCVDAHSTTDEKETRFMYSDLYFLNIVHPKYVEVFENDPMHKYIYIMHGDILFRWGMFIKKESQNYPKNANNVAKIEITTDDGFIHTIKKDVKSFFEEYVTLDSDNEYQIYNDYDYTYSDNETKSYELYDIDFIYKDNKLKLGLSSNFSEETIKNIVENFS